MDHDQPKSRALDSGTTTKMRDLSRLSGIIITIDVGDKPTETFYIHNNVLDQTSPVFRDRVQHVYTRYERASRIALPEYEPDSFRIYVNWLYMGGDIDINLEHMWLAYSLGQDVKDVAFQNTVMKAMTARYSAMVDIYPNLEAVEKVYKGTAKGSPLRRLFVDLWVRRAPLWKRDLGKGNLKTSDSFVCDLLVALAEKARVGVTEEDAPWRLKPKAYLLGKTAQ